MSVHSKIICPITCKIFGIFCFWNAQMVSFHSAVFSRNKAITLISFEPLDEPYLLLNLDPYKTATSLPYHTWNNLNKENVLPPSCIIFSSDRPKEIHISQHFTFTYPLYDKWHIRTCVSQYTPVQFSSWLTYSDFNTLLVPLVTLSLFPLEDVFDNQLIQ